MGQILLYGDEISIDADTSISIVAPSIAITGTTAIAGNASVIGTFGATGKVTFTNETDVTLANETVSDAAVKITGGVSIGKKLYTTGVATFATTTDATNTSSGSVIVKAYAELNGVKTAVQEATYTYQEPQQTPLTVKFMPPTTWETVYLFAWDGASFGNR